MNLREYAQHQSAEPLPELLPNTQPEQPAPTSSKQVEAAKKLIAERRLSHKIAEGCRLQILHDLEHKENPYRMLLLAAEAIGRLDYAGDTFFLQVQDKIKEVYGYDISEAECTDKV